MGHLFLSFANVDVWEQRLEFGSSLSHEEQLCTAGRYPCP